MNVTITQLEYIVAVDTHRNFARAAAHCYITQPTLSMQVKKLEELLTVSERDSKAVLILGAGKVGIAAARSLRFGLYFIVQLPSG